MALSSQASLSYVISFLEFTDKAVLELYLENIKGASSCLVLKMLHFTMELEAGEFLSFEASLGCIVRSCLKTNQPTTNQHFSLPFYSLHMLAF